MARRGRIVRMIWACCLLLAGLNHAGILLRHGLLWDYGGIDAASAAYWSILTLVDPAVALLLLVRPRLGVPAAAVLIATNVAHNLAATARWSPDAAAFLDALASWQLLSEIGFLLFVVATWRVARQGAAAPVTG